jgi:kynurenine formamidase
VLKQDALHLQPRFRHPTAMTEYRAHFDADVTFANGGGLQAQGFRLDLPGPDVTEEELARRFVAHLGLLVVGRVDLRGVRVVAEPHRGSQRRLVDLSHDVAAGTVTYPGLPGPEITPHLTRTDSAAAYAPGTTFAIDRISMVGNTGTYLDSPFHRWEDGDDLAGLPLAAVAELPAAVVRATGGPRGIDAAALAGAAVRGAAVLLHTGWDCHWGTAAYGDPAPFLTGDGAELLVERGAVLVGIDSVNIDDTADPERPAHSVLLRAGVPIVEHLTGLAGLPPTGARFTAAPPRVHAFGTFPVRAFASVPAA